MKSMQDSSRLRLNKRKKSCVQFRPSSWNWRMRKSDLKNWPRYMMRKRSERSKKELNSMRSLTKINNSIMKKSKSVVGLGSQIKVKTMRKVMKVKLVGMPKVGQAASMRKRNKVRYRIKKERMMSMAKKIRVYWTMLPNTISQVSFRKHHLSIHRKMPSMHLCRGCSTPICPSRNSVKCT